MAIEIFTDKEEYMPGEVIRARVQIRLDKPVKIRGVHAYLILLEDIKSKTTRAVPLSEVNERERLGLYTDVQFTYEERVDHHAHTVSESLLDGEGAIHEKEYQLSMRLPDDASPTSREFGHDNKIVLWNLDVKLDIPLAPDIHGVKEIFIGGL